MSRETLEFHHDKHHQAYVDKANDLIKGTDLEGKSLEDVVIGAHGVDQALFNNAAQHHNICTSGSGCARMAAALSDMIADGCGGMDGFKEKLVEAGTGQFGSGWVWLAWKDGKAEIMSTPNGENPLVHDAVPLLGCDVWEHA